MSSYGEVQKLAGSVPGSWMSKTVDSQLFLSGQLPSSFAVDMCCYDSQREQTWTVMLSWLVIALVSHSEKLNEKLV